MCETGIYVKRYTRKSTTASCLYTLHGRKKYFHKLRAYMVPTGTGNQEKTWKNGKAFSSQGILSRLEKSGNFAQNTGKTGKFE